MNAEEARLAFAEPQPTIALVLLSSAKVLNIDDHLIEKVSDGRNSGADKTTFRKSGSLML